ncbi:OmpA family protein [uncultured Roseivirga sp.]|uniref:OmpA family protein n=1 Tax=uncultured Roseivirga sp. TaxID=543088 RepID=UPI00258CF682|nr:OmpA family protein [uncultured Roseivirga sp.]
MKSLLLSIAILLSINSLGFAQRFGEPSAIKSVYFRGGSFYVDREQNKELQHFLDSIPHLHNFLITVHSHTDNVGGKEYNEWLSKMRGESVVDKLISNDKVKPESIEIRDFGLFNPIYDNSTREGRRKNRRVDIILWLAI